MNLELTTPTKPERSLIRRMLELYLHDFSEFDGSDLDEHGVYGYGDLDYFWFEETHAAFILRVDGNLAGFVLVDNEVVVDGNERSITEFFILRKYRRQGLGRQAANEVFDRLPARWEVRVIAENHPAQAFWRKVLTAYAPGSLHEAFRADDDWHGPVFWFDNRPA